MNKRKYINPVLAMICVVLIFIVYLSFIVFVPSMLVTIDPMLIKCIISIIFLCFSKSILGIVFKTGDVLPDSDQIIASLVSHNTFLVLLFFYPTLIAHCLSASRTFQMERSIGICIASVIYIAVESTLFERIIRFGFFESYLKYHCQTSWDIIRGVIISTILSSSLILASLRIVYNMEISIRSSCLVVLIELFLCYISISRDIYDRISRSASYARFHFHLSILAGSAFFVDGTPDLELNRFSQIVVVAFVLLTLLGLRKNNLQWIKSSIDEALSEHYSDNELPYKNTELFAEESTKRNMKMRYVLYAMGTSAGIILLWHWMTHFSALSITYLPYVEHILRTFCPFQNIENIEIAFIRNDGVEVLGTLISVTFLLTSFLSFLSSGDDIILWTDTMQYKLVLPRYFNFISMSIYTFVALLADIICYFLKYDTLVILFFVVDMFFLVILTFSMIEIYFYRQSILQDLKSDFYSANSKGQHEKLRALFYNTSVVLQNNDLKRLEEILSFLSDSYIRFSNLYNDALDFANADRIEKSDTDKRISRGQSLSMFDWRYSRSGFYTRKYSYFSILKRAFAETSKRKRAIVTENEHADLDTNRQILIDEIKDIRDELHNEIVHILKWITNEDIYCLTHILSDNTYGILYIEESFDIIQNDIKDRNLYDNEYYYVYLDVYASFAESIYKKFKVVPSQYSIKKSRNNTMEIEYELIMIKRFENTMKTIREKLGKLVLRLPMESHDLMKDKKFMKALDRALESFDRTIKLLENTYGIIAEKQRMTAK